MTPLQQEERGGDTREEITGILRKKNQQEEGGRLKYLSPIFNTLLVQESITISAQ